MNKDGECNNGFGTQGEKKEGDPIKRYTITLPLSSLPFFLKRTKGYVLLA